MEKLSFGSFILFDSNRFFMIHLTFVINMTHSPIFSHFEFYRHQTESLRHSQKNDQIFSNVSISWKSEKIKNLEILLRRETFSGSLRLWVSRKNNFGCWVILSSRLVLYFSAETNEKEINVENQKSEKSREIFSNLQRDHF